MRQNFPLRVDADLFDALKTWADDELRRANGQIEFLPRQSLEQAGRLPKTKIRENSDANQREEFPSE